MRLVRLGATDCSIPAVIQGCGTNVPLANSEVERWSAVVRHGVDLGLAAVDTAEVYGDGTSEIMVGRAAKGIREKFFIATKVSPQHLAYGDVIKAADASLRRLQTEYIDLYQIHWPNPQIALSETLDAMQELVAHKKVRFCGVSNFSVAALEEARAARAGIVANQLEYNVVDRSAEHGAVAFCRDNDVTLLAYSPLARLRTSASATKIAALQDIAARHRCEPEQLLLAWTIRHGHVAAIVRASRKENVERNLAAMSINLNSTDIAQIDALFPDNLQLLDPKRIRIVQIARENRKFYESIEEALANACHYSPSPAELAESLCRGDTLKPIKVMVRGDSDQSEFVLVEGQVRFWAHVIAKGNDVPIRGYVRDEEGEL
jgi:diketogulonate reductase-like aldo/keto reductase